jgi:hypothetical protein
VQDGDAIKTLCRLVIRAGVYITMFPVERLIEIIEEIARGNYLNNIMPLTMKENPEPMRIIAEAMAMMMVKVEAREYELENMVERLQKLNQRIKENAIKTVPIIAHALAARDTYAEGHTARVGEMAWSHGPPDRAGRRDGGVGPSGRKPSRFRQNRFLRNIRADIPITLCSGIQERGDMEKLTPFGISRLINMPAKMSELAKVIRDALDKKDL